MARLRRRQGSKAILDQACIDEIRALTPGLRYCIPCNALLSEYVSGVNLTNPVRPEVGPFTRFDWIECRNASRVRQFHHEHNRIPPATLSVRVAGGAVLWESGQPWRRVGFASRPGVPGVD